MAQENQASNHKKFSEAMQSEIDQMLDDLVRAELERRDEHWRRFIEHEMSGKPFEIVGILGAINAERKNAPTR